MNLFSSPTPSNTRRIVDRLVRIAGPSRGKWRMVVVLAGTLGLQVEGMAPAVAADEVQKARATCFDQQAPLDARIEACTYTVEVAGMRDIDVSDYLAHRAAASRAEGALEGAENDLSVLVSRAPTYNFITDRGTVRLAMGRHGQALLDFDEAQRLQPDAFASNAIGRGLALSALGRHDDAVDTLKASRNRWRDKEPVRAYAMARFARGDGAQDDNRSAWFQFEFADTRGDKNAHNRLWRYVTLARSGKVSRLLLTEYGATSSMGPGEAMRAVLGARPNGGSTRATREALVTWLFFTGESYLLDDDPVRAQQLLSEAVEVGVHESLAHIAALAELRRLEAR